jgi:hypothetical protein
MELEVIEGTLAVDIEVSPPVAVDISSSPGEVAVGLVLVPGAHGLPGRDGVVWFSGHGDPDETSIAGSHPGDYYLDLDSGTVSKLGD